MSKISLADAEREYVDWITSKQAASGRDSFHAIQGEDGGSTLCYLGGCDVSAVALAEVNVSHVLSLVSSRRNQKPAAAGGDFKRLVIDIEDDFEADLQGAGHADLL